MTLPRRSFLASLAAVGLPFANTVHPSLRGLPDDDNTQYILPPRKDECIQKSLPIAEGGIGYLLPAITGKFAAEHEWP